MSVKLRLKRMGRKKIPFYRVVAIDSRRQRDGAVLERLGVYNPLPEEYVFNINEERLFHWLEEGAEPSDTIHTLMQNHGLALKWHLRQQGASEEEIEREFQKWQLLRESKASAKAEQERRTSEEKVKREPAKAETAKAEEEGVEEAEEGSTEESAPAEEETAEAAADEEETAAEAEEDAEASGEEEVAPEDSEEDSEDETKE